MAQTFIHFGLERFQSLYEGTTEYNLSGSGIRPLNIRDLLQDDEQIEAILNLGLGYPETNGFPELREGIAALYDGASPDNVLVTVGAAQANYSSLQTVLETGDEVAFMTPNYMQIWGAAQNLGFAVKTFSLTLDEGWSLNQEELEKAVTEKTKLIAVCNPNNPTGYILTESEMQAIVAAAARVGAWILSDEVYTGTEHKSNIETPSFFGLYDKVIAVNSLSKAYNMPGLRLGWVVTNSELVKDIWARQDYVTIATTPLSNYLAIHALSPDMRPKLMSQTRQTIRDYYQRFEKLLENYDDVFGEMYAGIAAFALVKYHADINASVLAYRLRTEKSLLVLGGDICGIDGHLRLGFGKDEAYLTEGLNRLADMLRTLD
jgi:aspartate/methionine/tyrosine aminotransferase